MKLLQITQISFNNLKQRIIKMTASKVTYTAEEYGPAGIDSSPIKGMTAIYSRTESDGDECVIGYLLKNKLADLGETRVFSTNDSGELKTYHWLKNDGTQEFGGNSNHLATFEQLKSGFDQLRSDFNTLVSIFNTHVHVSPPAPVNPVVTAATVTPGTPSAATIDSAKLDALKTM